MITEGEFGAVIKEFSLFSSTPRPIHAPGMQNHIQEASLPGEGNSCLQTGESPLILMVKECKECGKKMSFLSRMFLIKHCEDCQLRPLRLAESMMKERLEEAEKELREEEKLFQEEKDRYLNAIK